MLTHPDMGEKVLETINTNDLSLLAQDRIFNLQKLFPYIPDSLNNILLHFSTGSQVFYNSVSEFQDELQQAVDTLP